MNSTPMLYLLSQWIINGKFTHWIFILQDFDLEFATPKSNKALVLAKFRSNLPSGALDPPLNNDLPNEHLFFISSEDP
jgi:hypothetical protein